MILQKLDTVLTMNNEFLHVLSDKTLRKNIEGVRSNSIGSQIACMLQARDAYGKSILENREFTWEPDFSHNDRYNIDVINKYAEKSYEWLLSKLDEFEEISQIQESLLFDLIAHEYLHQGQLVRYFYANSIPLPKMARDFWHLED